uniref:Uncharacterized protein n=1 Tax=Peronospora matthiolae TaxID=2874970 RepID=A0AAV1SZS0_9STRA
MVSLHKMGMTRDAGNLHTALFLHYQSYPGVVSDVWMKWGLDLDVLFGILDCVGKKCMMLHRLLYPSGFATLSCVEQCAFMLSASKMRRDFFCRQKEAEVEACIKRFKKFGDNQFTGVLEKLYHKVSTEDLTKEVDMRLENLETNS